MNKIPPKTTGKGGRPKGSQNKVTRDLREAIMATLDQVGGVEYLSMVALSDPKAFCALLGRTMPTRVSGPDGGPVALAVSSMTDAQLLQILGEGGREG